MHILLNFSSPKSVKDIPFTALTFTNVQLYRQNKSKSLRNLACPTLQLDFFFFYSTNKLTLNSTYTTCILHLFIWSKRMKAINILAIQKKCAAEDGSPMSMSKKYTPAHSQFTPLNATHLTWPHNISHSWNQFCYTSSEAKHPGMTPRTGTIAHPLPPHPKNSNDLKCT